MGDMKELIQGIETDLAMRMACCPNSMAPSPDEVRIAACLCEIQNLRAIIKEYENKDVINCNLGGNHGKDTD